MQPVSPQAVSVPWSALLSWLGSPWYEFIDEVAAALLCVLLGLRLWIAVDGRSRAAARYRRMLSRRGARHLFWAAVAVCALFVAAEGVLDPEPDELFTHLDAAARHAGQLLATTTRTRHAAAWMSQLSGIGLVSGVGSVATCFLVLRRRREALIVLVGSLTAWMMSGLLKLAFGVPRPNSLNVGFPSGHAMVAVVAFGLIAWCLGRFASPSIRRVLYGAAGAAVLLTGAARIIVDAHWLSDVIGGLAAGTLWLNLVLLVASLYRDEESDGVSARELAEHGDRPGHAMTPSLRASAGRRHFLP